MAKLKVMSTEIIAPLGQKEEVLHFLQSKGTLEIISSDEGELFSVDAAKEISQAHDAAVRISAAMEVLDARCPVKKPITAMLEPRKDLDSASFFGGEAKAQEALALAEKIRGLDAEIADIRAEEIRLRTKSDALAPWKSVDLPREEIRSKYVARLTGSVRKTVSREDILTYLASVLPENESVEAEILYSEESERTGKTMGALTAFSVYCLKDDREEVETALRNFGFIDAPDTGGRAYAEVLGEYEACFSRQSEKLTEISDQIARLSEKREMLEFAADFYTAKEDSLSAGEKAGQTQRIFRIKGWAAEKDAKKIKKQMEEKFDAAVEVTEPAEEDDVPVILSNGFFSAPLENITGMYSLPSGTDIDPTGPMTFFYYLFFGMMLSDAGYGLLIALATGGILLLKKNLEKKMRNTLRMYFFCGLSTVFWGAMYGSWFGDVGQVVMREFFHRDVNPLPPIWTDAVTDTMNVLIMCFILGLLHLFWGVLMKGYTDVKRGSVLDAVFDTIPTFLTVIGMAPIFFGLFVQDSIPEDYTALGTFLYHAFMRLHTGLSQVSVYILILGLVLLIATAGRKSKSIGGKIGGGFYAVYNIFSGYLGDVLSYARLLALGMATGVIAQVMNMLGTLPSNPVIKVLAFIPVFIVGHAANLAINIIGAYVHTNRLQYVEFFSKFYEGGGRAFVPFEAKTNYYKFKEEI